MDEKHVADSISLKNELDQAKKDIEKSKEHADKQLKESTEVKARLDAQIDVLNKTLAEEKAKLTTACNELERVKSRNILGKSS